MSKKKRTAPHRTATRKPDRPQVVSVRPSYRPQPLRVDEEVIAGLLLQGEPEHLIVMLPTLLWIDAAAHHRLPPNLCLEAAHTLRQAYLWLGLQADIIPVRLDLEHRSGRRTGTRYGSDRAHYSGTDFVGHCVLHLPEMGRMIDATVGQFPEIARGTGAPIVGKDAFSTGGVTDGFHTPGVKIKLIREDWILTYAPVPEPYSSVVYEGPCATPEAQAGFYSNGLRLASHVMAALNVEESCAGRARQLGLPRLNALMDAVTGAQWTPEDDQLDLFTFPDGTRQPLRDLPLPAGTPPPRSR